jgi:hypothetical protein
MRAVFFAGLATILLVASPVRAQPTPSMPSLDGNQLSRLARGEVLVHVDGGEHRVGESIGVVHARIEAVVNLLRDLESYDRIFEHTLRSEIVGQDGEFMLQSGITTMPWPMADREWTVRVWQGYVEIDGLPGWQSTWDYLPGSGNLLDLQGDYLLLPWGEDGLYTLVRYRVAADLGTWLPASLLPWSVEDLLPNQIEAIRHHLLRDGR